MKLLLIGHDYRYAVEQIMLSLFPNERPEYDSPPDAGAGSLSAESRLSYGNVFAQAITVIYRGKDVSRGYARVRASRLTGKLTTDRLLQRIVKQSFFKAAAPFIEAQPVWGSLTGIRPARLAAEALSSGKDERIVARMLTREYYVSPDRAELCVEAARSALDVMSSLDPADIALYIGVPFCPSRCAYCSFVSNDVEKSFGLVAPFTETLLREIQEVSAAVGALGLRIVTVYIGGGTPTVLPPNELEAVMDALEKSFDLSRCREYTVEAGRPETVTAQKLEIMNRYGCGRVCVNPQSMSADVLKAIGRGHTPEDVIDAVRLVRRSGMSLNMDIIAGLPGDTREAFRRTLDAVLRFAPENITVHTLSLKKGARVMLENTPAPSGADVAGMLEYSSRRLRESGYRPYYIYRQKYTSGGFENTGWRLPGRECLYNICMMEELCTVLALGGGGVTKLVAPGGRIERVFNAKYPREYIAQSDKQRSSKLERKIDRIESFLSGGE